jgi:hypothetical protein
MHPKDTHTHTHQQELHPMHSKDTHTSMSFIIGNPNTHTHTHQCELHPVHTKDARHEWPCVNAHTNSQSCPCIHSLCAAKSDGQEHGQPRVILSAQIWPATSDPISTDLANYRLSNIIPCRYRFCLLRERCFTILGTKCVAFFS